MTKRTKLKVGFIGCGRHATKVLYPSLRYAPISLEAICDLDERLVKRNAAWFGARKSYTDYQQMLDDINLDAVIVCTGPASHAQLAKTIIQRGIPVFIEKPPALTLDKAQKLESVSENVGVPVTVGLMKRYAAIYRQMKDILESRDFGQLAHIGATLRLGSKKCSGYALLLDAGIHILDLVMYMAGDVIEIHTEKWQQEQGLAYALALSFKSGAVGTVHITDQGSWLSAEEVVELTGNGETVRGENLLKLSHTKKSGRTNLFEPGFSIPQNQNNSLFIQGYAQQFQIWAQTLLEGNWPEPTILTTCKTMDLIKSIEPDENYQKETQKFEHWKREDFWLSVE